MTDLTCYSAGDNHFSVFSGRDLIAILPKTMYGDDAFYALSTAEPYQFLAFDAIAELARLGNDKHAPLRERYVAIRDQYQVGIGEGLEPPADTLSHLCLDLLAEVALSDLEKFGPLAERYFLLTGEAIS